MSLVGDDVPAAPARPAKANPFGAARPREQVIAEREGKRETEVLKEQVQRDWKPLAGQPGLTDAQYEEKKALEAELAYAKSDLEKATDPTRINELKEEVALKEQKLQDVLASFEAMSVRPVRRERKKDEAGGYPPQAEDFASFNRGRSRDGGPPATGYLESQDYGSFSRGGGRDATGYPESQDYGSFSRGGGRGGRDAYGSAWSGGSRGGSRDCYNCGQPGHISRDCPNGRASYGGAFGGGRAGGRDCYNCHEEGHLARDCPREPSAGGGSSGGYQEAGYRQDSGGVQGGYDYYARGR